eukprot:6031012-Pleurochrysis_carterae.AAC.1
MPRPFSTVYIRLTLSIRRRLLLLRSSFQRRRLRRPLARNPRAIARCHRARRQQRNRLRHRLLSLRLKFTETSRQPSSIITSCPQRP